MIITWNQFVWGFALLLAWTGLLLGAIKYLLNKQIMAFETKIAEAEAKAIKASTDVAAIRLEVSQKMVCHNHDRMEGDNREQFQRLAKLGGSLQRMDGKLDGIITSIDMLMQHHLKGEGK